MQAALLPQAASGDVNPAVAETLFAGRGIAITRLERFALCPCRHFIQNGLRPHELYEPGIRPVDAGTLFHDALDRVIGAAVRQGIPWEELGGAALDALLKSEAEPLLAEILATPGYEGGRTRARVEEIRRTLDKTARVLAFQLEGSLFVPTGRELAFGEEQSVPPLEVALPSGEVMRLEGRIDRVDTYRTGDARYLRVIDYKSGDAHLDLDAMRQGISLQLPLYAKVAERALGGEAAGIFYSKIADAVVDEPDDESDATRTMARKHRLDGLLLADEDIARAMDAPLMGERIPAKLKRDGAFDAYSRVVDREGFQAMLNAAQDTAASLAGRMLSGEASPAPAVVGKESACKHCPYKGVCGLEQR
jgi:ATP-dependent helicase/nuclease subunit B